MTPSDITFCLLSCGEDTESDCLSSIMRFSDKFTYQEVRNIAPQSVALNQMIIQCETPFLVPLDADFILYDNFIDRIEEKIQKFQHDNKWHSILFGVMDVLTETKIRSLKVFQSAIVKSVLYRNERHPDLLHWQDLKAKGYHAHDFVNAEPPIGDHVVRGYRRCYLRYKNIMLCTRATKNRQEVISEYHEQITKLNQLYVKTQKEDYLACINGLYDGLTTTEDFKESDSYLSNIRFTDPQHAFRVLKRLQWI